MASTVDMPSGAYEQGSKGLKGGALGLLSSVVIGVSSTAPGYSIAATLGGVVALVAFQAPAVRVGAGTRGRNSAEAAAGRLAAPKARRERPAPTGLSGQQGHDA